jgi:hypothetical protein
MSEMKIKFAFVKGGKMPVGGTCVGFSKAELSFPFPFMEPPNIVAH